MSIFEYNKEEEMKKYRQAEREGAIEEGIEIGVEIGREIGRNIGVEIGRERERKNVILRLLAGCGLVPEGLRSEIEKESDLEVLEGWFELALEVNSIEEFQAQYLKKK